MEIKSIRDWLIERGYNPEYRWLMKDESLHDLLWAFFCHLNEEGYERRRS